MKTDLSKTIIGDSRKMVSQSSNYHHALFVQVRYEYLIALAEGLNAEGLKIKAHAFLSACRLQDNGYRHAVRN